jgi:hypothetical protein
VTTPNVARARELLHEAVDGLEPYTKGGFEPNGTAEKKAEHYRIVLNIFNRQVVGALTALGWNADDTVPVEPDATADPATCRRLLAALEQATSPLATVAEMKAARTAATLWLAAHPAPSEGGQGDGR